VSKKPDFVIGIDAAGSEYPDVPRSVAIDFDACKDVGIERNGQSITLVAWKELPGAKRKALKQRLPKPAKKAATPKPPKPQRPKERFCVGCGQQLYGSDDDTHCGNCEGFRDECMRLAMSALLQGMSPVLDKPKAGLVARSARLVADAMYVQRFMPFPDDEVGDEDLVDCEACDALGRVGEDGKGTTRSGAPACSSCKGRGRVLPAEAAQ
jgi:hypothetical protein